MGLTKPKVTGVELPVLSNAATAENIEAGFEAIDGLGAVIQGSLVKKDFVSGTVAGTGKKTISHSAFSGKNRILLVCISPEGAGGEYQYSCAYIKDGSGKAHRSSANTPDTVTLSGSTITSSSNNYFASSRTFMFCAWNE